MRDRTGILASVLIYYQVVSSRGVVKIVGALVSFLYLLKMTSVLKIPAKFKVRFFNALDFSRMAEQMSRTKKEVTGSSTTQFISYRCTHQKIDRRICENNYLSALVIFTNYFQSVYILYKSLCELWRLNNCNNCTSSRTSDFVKLFMTAVI